MSRTRRLQRSHLRALSGSESEEDPSFLSNREKLLRKKTKKSESVSVLNSSAKHTSALEENASVYGSSNHRISTQKVSSTAFKSDANSNYSFITPTGNLNSNQRIISPDSQAVDMSVVQYTKFDKFRWLLWRYIYLKIITTVNFDVWLLSRLHEKKYKAVLLLLFPLLLYLLYFLATSEDETILRKPFDLIFSPLLTFVSTVYSFVSSVYSFISFPFFRSQQLVEDHEEISNYPCGFISTLLPSFGGIFGSLSNLFVKENSHFSSEASSKSFESITEKSSFDSNPIVAPSSDVKASREEIRSVAVEVLEEKFNDLVNNFYDSSIHSANLKMKDETSKIQTEIHDLQHQFQSLSDLLKQLEIDFRNLKKSGQTSAKNFDTLSTENSAHFRLLNEKMKTFEVKLESLGGIKKCCDQKISPAEFTSSIEKYIVAAFRNVVEAEEKSNSPYSFFSEWLNAKITDSSRMSSEINLAFEKLRAQLKTDTRQDKESLRVIEGIVQHYVESLKRNFTFTSSTGNTFDSLSVNDMRKIAKEAIMLYDADKTGLVDYALESSGGSVLGTRCSESYIEKNGKFSVFGLPLWSDTNSPRTAIQPNVQPGECWAFKGSQGFLVIQLSYTIYPTGFTLEHIPVSLSPTGSIDSAPKDFSVWGLDSEVDNEGTILGKYSYDQNGEPLQYFPLQNFTTKAFSFIELKINSNHGNLEYTCLYRFRVHGTRVK